MLDTASILIEPGGGSPAYLVDLTEFFTGRVPKDGDNGRPSKSFRGRPGFAEDLGHLLKATGAKKSTANPHRYAMRHLLSVLDGIDPDGAIKSCADLGDHHGPGIRAQLDVGQYRVVKLLVDAMRRVRRLPKLYWEPVPPKELTQTKDIERDDILKIHTALKSEARSIMSMFDEGKRLADAGTDPREPDAVKSDRANQAWLVRHLTADRLLRQSELVLMTSGVKLDQNGPTYFAPGMDKRVQGYQSQLRWFYPSIHDTSVMLWLFLIRTGWNLGTALSIDVSTPESWFQEHPSKPWLAIIGANKARSQRHQYTVVKKKPLFHPYRIIQLMIERTAPMRRLLQHERNLLDIGDETDPHIILQKAELDAALKSPWLVHRTGEVGKAFALGHADVHLINEVARDVVLRHRLDQSNPALLKLTTKDVRKVWIGHAYAQSGRSALIAKMAAQHSNHSTLEHYIGGPKLRDERSEAVRAVQNAIFNEIAAGRVLDPTRLRLISQYGDITSEQATRLLDLRQRTRLGMGCLEPTSPPKTIAPDHVEGSLCRVQRCTGCKHGVVFSESLQSLARAHAELIHMKSTMPLASWMSSSFADEECSISETLKNFDADRVKELTEGWLGRFKRGEAHVHDVYPSY